MNIDEQYRVKFLEKTVAELLDRVEALEAKAREAESAADELDYQSRRIDALQNKSDTFDGRCIVPEERVLRWERIERAARRLLHEMASYEWDQGVTRDAKALCEALKP